MRAARSRLAGDLVPELVGHRVGPVAQARDRLGERQRGALGVGEVGRVPPGGHGEQLLLGGVRFLGVAPAVVDAEAAPVDLASPQVHQLQRRFRHAAFLGALGQRLHCLASAGDEHGRVLHPRLDLGDRVSHGSLP